MMQNGFRRIALAQGLLPARLPPNEASTQAAPFNAQHSDASQPDRAAPGEWDSDCQPRVAGAATASS